MQKIVFSITKLNKSENAKTSGTGYIIDENILIPAMSTNNKQYIKVFEDAVKYCYPVLGTENEYKGAYTEYVTGEFPDKNGALETKEIVVDYFIWYKKVD